jgi:hypothetical protein
MMKVQQQKLKKLKGKLENIENQLKKKLFDYFNSIRLKNKEKLNIFFLLKNCLFILF